MGRKAKVGRRRRLERGFARPRSLVGCFGMMGVDRVRATIYYILQGVSRY